MASQQEILPEENQHQNIPETSPDEINIENIVSESVDEDLFCEFVNSFNDFPKPLIHTKEMEFGKMYKILKMMRFESNSTDYGPAVRCELEDNIYFLPKKIGDIVLKKSFGDGVRRELQFKNLYFVVYGKCEKNSKTFFNYKLLSKEPLGSNQSPPVFSGPNQVNEYAASI